MDYIIGSFATAITILVLLLVMRSFSLSRQKSFKVKHTQSKAFVNVFEPHMRLPKPRTPSQATKYNDKRHIRVVFSGPKAYWISDNTFYEAGHIFGLVDKESAKAVDIMGMDKVQLDKMIFIVEALTEGTLDEDWGSGN